MAEQDNIQSHFTFRHLQGKEFNFLVTRETKELLQKWSLYDRMKTALFNYDQKFQQYQMNDFFSEFFKSSQVFGNVQVMSSSGSWAPLGVSADKVSVNQLHCSLTSLEFFDRLSSEGIVRENGSIVKCFDEFYENFTISDELRKMLVVEDSDNYDIYSKEERSEFLFRILRHIALGGPVCQYEDNIGPYLNTAKAIYKDLVTVQMDGVTKKPVVSSMVFEINAMDKDDTLIFPTTNHLQTFCYAIVDPAKRYIKLWYYTWGGGPF